MNVESFTFWTQVWLLIIISADFDVKACKENAYVYMPECMLVCLCVCVLKLFNLRQWNQTGHNEVFVMSAEPAGDRK